MAFPASTKIQHKRATAAEWTSDNTVLLSGEIGIESDTNLAKAGNGSDGWNDLPYISGTKTYEGYTSAAASSYITIAYCLPASLNKNAILEIEAQDSNGHMTKVFLFLTVAVDSSYVTSSRIEISGVCSQGHATDSGFWILDYLRVGYEHVGAKHIIQVRKKTAATLIIKTTSYLFNDWVIQEGNLDFILLPFYSQDRYLTPGSLEYGYSFGTVRPSTCDAGDRFLETDVEVLSGAVGSNVWRETPLLNSNPGSRIKNVSADYSMLKENIFLLVNSSASSVVIALPDPSTCYPGQLYTIKNVGYSVSYGITIKPYDTEKIDNQSGDIVLSASEGEAVTLMTDGTDWHITSNYSGEYT